MLNAQSLRHRSMLAKIGQAMRAAVDNAAANPFGYGAKVAVRNAKGRVTLVVLYSRAFGWIRPRRTGFQFFDYTADGSPEITPLVLSVLREHGDVADALPATDALPVTGSHIHTIHFGGHGSHTMDTEIYAPFRRMPVSLMGAV